ncbi:hypothetical protein GCM10009854_46550 [Saccharopolyspora halophila]|uniref:DUF3040 domain-containing protein n=1 Tax=Saccharopolyspora halophila TaxID=405551 RepID=A0ABP5TVE3_9PSEU
MLSRHEWDRLAEIEAALASADPEFVERFDRFDGSSTWEGVRKLMLFALLSIVALTAVVFLVSGFVWISAGLAALTAVGTAIVVYDLRRRARD